MKTKFTQKHKHMPTHAAVQLTSGKLQLNDTALIDTTVDNVIAVGMIRQFRRLGKELKPNKLNTHQKFFDQTCYPTHSQSLCKN